MPAELSLSRACPYLSGKNRRLRRRQPATRTQPHRKNDRAVQTMLSTVSDPVSPCANGHYSLGTKVYRFYGTEKTYEKSLGIKSSKVMWCLPGRAFCEQAEENAFG